MSTEPTAPELHVYDNDHDIVIAHSPEDASAIVAETLFPDVPTKVTGWNRLADDESMDFCDDDQDESLPTTRLASEWIAMKGRGYMGSHDR